MRNVVGTIRGGDGDQIVGAADPTIGSLNGFDLFSAASSVIGFVMSVADLFAPDENAIIL